MINCWSRVPYWLHQFSFSNHAVQVWHLKRSHLESVVLRNLFCRARSTRALRQEVISVFLNFLLLEMDGIRPSGKQMLQFKYSFFYCNRTMTDLFCLIAKELLLASVGKSEWYVPFALLHFFSFFTDFFSCVFVCFLSKAKFLMSVTFLSTILLTTASFSETEEMWNKLS